MILAALFALLAALLCLLPPLSKATCIANIWLIHIGFSIIFVSLGVKSYRIAMIFTEDNMATLDNLTNKRLSMYVLGSVGIVCCCLTVVTFYFPNPQEVTVNGQFAKVCYDNAPISILLLELLECFLLLGLT